VADILTKEKRSALMSRIRGRNTKPELAVRSLLHRLGYRFRLHVRDLPGRPDIVLPRYRLVVLVHGCFWHRHSGCRFCYVPKTRADFWHKKFEGNIRRDREVQLALRKIGWRVMVVWECEVKDVRRLNRRMSRTLNRFKSNPEKF
jgi:DNA mismatch endonuclease, patch repair protein